LYSDDANVDIIGSSRKDVHVYIYRKEMVRGLRIGSEREFEVDVDERNGDLIIRERESSGHSFMTVGVLMEDYEISLEVPKGVSLVLKGDDDDYRIENVNGSITLDVDDGDAELRNCNGNHFDFNVDDGDIEMRGGNGFLYVRSDDGDVIIRDGNFSEINATLDDGDIVIETTLTDKGEYSFRVDDGSIDFKVLGGGGEFEIRHDDSRIISSDSFRIIEEDENETRLKLSNGSARIIMRADDSRIRLSSL